MKQVPRVPRLRILLLALPSPARDPSIVIKSSSMAARIWLRGNQESKCVWYLCLCLARPLLASLLRQHLHEVHIQDFHIYVLGDRIEALGAIEKKFVFWGIEEKLE